MTRYDFAVVGNSAAAMVAATELARGGNTVTLWNSTPQWGAHFGGVELAGRRFDIGMNFLEFTSFAAQSDRVEGYSVHTRNDVARFTDVVRNYVGGLLEFTRSDTPQSLLHGVFAPDLVISNRLDLLSTLMPKTRGQIVAELVTCVAAFQKDPTWHARNKLHRAEQFAAADYQAVSLANHGATLHELLIEPTCRRILGLSSAEISALLHRAAWTPLYYPETILQRLQGGVSTLPPTEFFYPCSGSFAAVITALEHRLGQTPRLELQRDKLERLKRDGTGWLLNGESYAARLVWAQRPGQLVAMLGGEDDNLAYRKASVHVAFATVESTAFTRRFSSLFVLDADSPVYRVTNQTWSAKQDSPQAVCSIEISSATAAGWRLNDLPALTHEIAGQLAQRGVLRERSGLTLHAVRHLKDAILAPTAANRKLAIAGRTQLESTYPDVELIGAAASFGASSFNDYVIQGIRLGRIYSRA